MVDRSEHLLRARSTNGSPEGARVCSGGKLTRYFKRLRAVLVYEAVTSRVKSTFDSIRVLEPLMLGVARGLEFDLHRLTTAFSYASM